MPKACRILRSQEELRPISLRTVIEELGMGQTDTTGSGEGPVARGVAGLSTVK
jgi:hypothetical protein